MTTTTSFTSFQSLAPRYAHVIGGRDRVSVTFGGDVAFTDGRRINLPAFEAGTVMTPWQAKVYNGYLDHETAHIRYTDFRELDRANQKYGTIKGPQGKSVLDPVTKAIWNLLEDVRIENKQIDDYPGSKTYLDALYNDIEDRVHKGEPENQAEELFRLMYKEGYCKYRGLTDSNIQGNLGDKLEYEPIAKAMEGLSKCKSTTDTIELAVKIKNLIPKNVDWNSKAEEEEIRLLMVVDGAVNGDEEALQALIKAAETFEGDTERGQLLQALIQEIKDKNDQLMKNSSGKVEQNWSGGEVLPPLTTAKDKIFVPSEENISQYEIDRASASAQITALKKMLSIYLRARSNRAWSRGLEHGLLDEHLLHTVPQGNRLVYKERRERPIIDTAIELLTDNSGSMNAGILRVAAIMLAEALTGIRSVKLSITGYTTYGNIKYNQHNTQPGIGRLESLSLMIYKDYDEPYNKAKGRLGAIKCTLSTPTGDAYGQALERILSRKEKRRIIWIISDGQPAYATGDSRHNDFYLQERIHRKCNALGIEAMGLGIGTSNLKDYVDPDKFTMIRNISELATNLMEILKRVI